MNKILLLIFSFLLSSNLQAQSSGTQGTEFWFTFMENLTLAFNGDPEFTVYVSATEDGTATITAPFTGLTFSFSYEANSVTEYTLPNNIFYAQGSETIANFGLKINTTSEVSVRAVHYRIYFCDSSLILPTDVLGDEYVIPAGKDASNSASSPSSLVIVATENNTEIEIIPSVNTAGLRPANIPFTISLDAGNSYQIQASGDLTGSKVRSIDGSKIAVFSGAKKAFVFCFTSADNHLYDQVYPVNYADDSYALIPFKDQGFSIFKILAIEDETDVFINNNLFATLQAGEYIEKEYDSPRLLTSSKNVFVTQFNPSQLCTNSQVGDPSMLHLHSSDYRIKNALFENISGFSGSPQAFSVNNITLFTETENVENILLDGIDISNQFIDFPGFSNYQYAMISLETGTSKLEAPRGVFAYTYGFGDFDGYTHGLGFDPNSEVSVSEVDHNKISVFPNPATYELSISSNEMISSIDILTIDGQSLKRNTINHSTANLNTQEYPSGIYILKIHSENKVYFKKFVKQ